MREAPSEEDTRETHVPTRSGSQRDGPGGSLGVRAGASILGFRPTCVTRGLGAIPAVVGVVLDAGLDVCPSPATLSESLFVRACVHSFIHSFIHSFNSYLLEPRPLPMVVMKTMRNRGLLRASVG